MTNRKYPSELELIKVILGWVLNGQISKDPSTLLKADDFQWLRFNDIINYHEIYPFVFFFFSSIKVSIPQEWFDSLKKRFNLSSAYNFYLWNELKILSEEFQKDRLDFIPLKGSAFILENLYKDYEYARPMVDMDLLVRRQDLLYFEKKLETLGYEKNLLGLKEEYWKNKSYHLGFIKNPSQGCPFPIEIHWEMTYGQDNANIINLWNRKSYIESNGFGMNILAPEDTLITLALNQRHFGKTLCLKNVLDTSMLLAKYKDTLDWRYIAVECKRAKFASAVFYLLYQVGLINKVDYLNEFLSRLVLSKPRMNAIKKFIDHNSFNVKNDRGNKVSYFKSVFLLYDSIVASFGTLFNAPEEKFAMFYNLKPYTLRTAIIYNFRIIYSIFNEIYERLIKEFISKTALNLKQKAV